jgi:hypothetical protein
MKNHKISKLAEGLTSLSIREVSEKTDVRMQLRISVGTCGVDEAKISVKSISQSIRKLH